MEKRHIALLILVAGIMPLVWGWTVHWLISKLWAENRRGAHKPSANPSAPPPLDYQI